MKNIHVIPTSQPSRLMIDTIENKLYLQSILHEKTINVLPQNIYITNDEDIMIDDYYIAVVDIYQCLSSAELEDLSIDSYCKKIILTTDQDLIKDGVQAIDDEFLEWFIKNPSCKSVEVLEAPKLVKMIDNEFYKIFISKEEPKKETLEEVAYNACNKEGLSWENDYAKEKFIEGAKWQQEQDNKMYSEEEVINILIKFNDCSLDFDFDSEVEDWFEQFKNK